MRITRRSTCVYISTIVSSCRIFLYCISEWFRSFISAHIKRSFCRNTPYWYSTTIYNTTWRTIHTTCIYRKCSRYIRTAVVYYRNSYCYVFSNTIPRYSIVIYVYRRTARSIPIIVVTSANYCGIFDLNVSFAVPRYTTICKRTRTVTTYC